MDAQFTLPPLSAQMQDLSVQGAAPAQLLPRPRPPRPSGQKGQQGQQTAPNPVLASPTDRRHRNMLDFIGVHQSVRESALCGDCQGYVLQAFAEQFKTSGSALPPGFNAGFLDTLDRLDRLDRLNAILLILRKQAGISSVRRPKRITKALAEEWMPRLTPGEAGATGGGAMPSEGAIKLWFALQARYTLADLAIWRHLARYSKGKYHTFSYVNKFMQYLWIMKSQAAWCQCPMVNWQTNQPNFNLQLSSQLIRNEYLAHEITQVFQTHTPVESQQGDFITPAWQNQAVLDELEALHTQGLQQKKSTINALCYELAGLYQQLAGRHDAPSHSPFANCATYLTEQQRIKPGDVNMQSGHRGFVELDPWDVITGEMAPAADAPGIGADTDSGRALRDAAAGEIRAALDELAASAEVPEVFHAIGSDAGIDEEAMKDWWLDPGVVLGSHDSNSQDITGFQGSSWLMPEVDTEEMRDGRAL